MDIPLIMEVLALSYPELSVPIRSICFLQRHRGHLCPCRHIHHQGPAAQRDTHTHHGSQRTLTCHCNVDLSWPRCQLPILWQLWHARGAQGLQAEGAVGAEVSERRAPARRLPPRQPLHVKGYVICARHVGLGKHSSTLLWECSTCSTHVHWVKPHTHTHTHFFSCCGCPEVTQQRNAWMNNFYLLKRRKKKQKKGLRHKEGTQVHLYHSLCLYGLPQPRQTLNSVSSSKNPGMLLTAKTDHPQNICYYFLRNM